MPPESSRPGYRADVGQSYFSYLSVKIHAMLKSMTGFGRAERLVGDKTFLVELRSLNGKQFELTLKIPQMLKPYEFEIRNRLSEKLLRGTIECTVSLKQNGASRPVTVNSDLIRSYHHQLTDIAAPLGLDTSNLLDAILKLPDAVVAATDAISRSEWESFASLLEEASDGLDSHRCNEGAAIEKDLRLRVSNIRSLQSDVTRLDAPRKERMRDRLRKLLEEQVGPERYDANRMEQELIYHIERMDINEELVRLSNHCDYFETLLDEQADGKGKKLGFVLQEIGREINTTGSKANDSEMQKAVVMMKDELEKAKEQVLNVL